MTSKQSLGGSCSPTPPSPPPPPLPPPNPPPPLASIQQEMPSSSSSIEQQQRHHHHDVVMEGSVTPPALPSTSTHQISPGASTTTSTPSSTSSAKGAGSSGSATTATTGTTGTTTTATRNKRQELSFAERIQVIQARTSGKSMRQLALQFGCGKTQILNILGQREAYLKEWEDKQAESNPHISARKRRSRRTGNEETNQKVWDWYNRQKNMGIRVTGPMLQREARSIARNLNIPNFAASNGWLDSFRRLHNIGPQNKGMADRRSGNPSTSAAGTGGGQSSTTPEPRPGYGSMLVASSSSSTEFPGSSHSTQVPSSSRDPLPSTTSSTSQRPPPPLEAFGYPLHSSGYYHHHPQVRLEEEDEEEDDEEEEEEARRSNEDIEFDPSRPVIQTIHSHRDHGALHHPETEFGRSFALMANFHDSSNSTGGPSTHHPSVSPSPYHPAQSSSSVDASDFHRHRGGYSDPYDRLHSSSSSNSVAFSPTDVYSPSRHPSGQHHQSPIVGHRNNNNGSRSTDLSPMDCRRAPSGNLISPSFQQVSSSLFEHDFTPAPTFQSNESSRSIIQDGRARGNGGGSVSGAALQQQQQRRTSVLTSTHAVTAAAAAAAAASLENQQLQQQQQQQMFNEERARSSSAPGLELFPPVGLFDALLSMVRSCGLSCLEYADDRGDLWLEIKPPSFATFRVPSFGYRTHLMRLLVDRHLSYWFEVLGHCVRSGTFRSLTSGGIDPSLVKPLLDSLNGGATVCHGRGSVLKRVHQFHPKEALEQGLSGQNYFTLPDYRYRSYDCARLIDAKTGATQCFACLQPYEPHRPESPLDGIHASSVIRLQQQQPRDGLAHPSTTSQQQEEQHNRQQQQQQQQQHNLLTNEPLNLSIHPIMEESVIDSPDMKKTDFHFVSPDGFSNRNITFTGRRLLTSSPSAVARLSPQLPLAVQQTSPQPTIQQHHHHHHHYYNSGSKPNAVDQNPDDYRLAKEAAFLSLTNERPPTKDQRRNQDWQHITTTNRENLGSKFGTGTEVDMKSDVPEFPNEWIKQEVLDSSNNMITFK